MSKKMVYEKRIVFPRYGRLSHLRKPEIVWLATHYCNYSRWRRPSYLEDYNCFLREHPELEGRFPSRLGSVTCLSKDDILWLATHYCKNIQYGRPLYLSNYDHFIKEHPEMVERIGFLDIESSNFDANFGIILTYCLLDSQTRNILWGKITKEDILKYPDDKTDIRIIKKLIKELKRFDRVVTHYGRKFDIPFVRTRALYNGIEFPSFGLIANDDSWLIARRKLKLNSNRQTVVDMTLFGDTNKTRVEFKYWIAGERGDAKALDWILDHNKRDVIALERVWQKLNGFVSRCNTSI